MIEFGGIIYQIDIDKLKETVVSSEDPNAIISEKVVKTYFDQDNKLVSREVLETFKERGYEIDSIKYDLIKMLIDILMDDLDEELDDSLGSERALAKKPLSYRIAYNTLKQHNILKEV